MKYDSTVDVKHRGKPHEVDIDNDMFINEERMREYQVHCDEGSFSFSEMVIEEAARYGVGGVLQLLVPICWDFATHGDTRHEELMDDIKQLIEKHKKKFEQQKS